MKSPVSRRLFILSSAQLLAGGSLLGLTRPLYSDQDTPVTAPHSAPPVKAQPKSPPPKPPTLAPDKVQAAVGQAHRSLENVMKLVEETPLLANACWDWGGGDFETPLQAAAHTGQHAIAEYLLRKGARLDVYAAAMLGQLDFIKAVLTLDPQAHAIPGPHGFTLLHCALQGGERAEPVHQWLLAQGVPDVTYRPLPFVGPAGAAPAA
ncbi:MAG: hypothetical protein PSV13_14065 [Lacunisphaera sp.]|nr:hypothetical protein [Lacunisphaera sp.]